MTLNAPLLFAGMMLVAMPAAASPSQRLSAEDPNDPAQGSDTEVFSAVAGKILGAASVCDQISTDRVSVATDKALAIVNSSTDTDDEASSAKQLLVNGAAEGRDAVENGGADCSIVEASLSTLEEIEADDPSGQPGDQGDQEDEAD